jgi:sulfite exporter TauE/SafE
MTALLAGLAFGLLGSGHCATMCGPLVLLANPRAAGLGTSPACLPRRKAGHAALYHGGRASTYIVLGGLVGLVGGALTHLGFGRMLAVVAGLALVVQAAAATGIVTSRPGSPRLGIAVSRALGRAGTWMRSHPVMGPVVFGALNGLLPCGLLYAALTAAGGFGTLGQSLLFMGAFAVGTTPMLAVIGVAGGSLTARVPHLVRRATPAALAIVGMLLIVRGVRPPHEAHGADAIGAATSTHPHSH